MLQTKLLKAQPAAPRLAARAIGAARMASNSHTPQQIITYNEQKLKHKDEDLKTHPSLLFSSYERAFPPPQRNIGIDAVVKAANGEIKMDEVRDVRDAMDFSGRHAVITGATGGLGLEHACTLLPLGTKVHVIDLKEPGAGSDFAAAKEYAKYLRESGKAPTAGLEYYKGDVTNAEELYKLVGDISDKAGRLDFCIANAGILGEFSDAEKYSPEMFDKVMKVNVEGANNTAAAAARAMKKHHSQGRIIFTASMSGSIVNRDMGWTAYTSSKAAVKHLSKSYAVQLAPYGITSNSISPGHMWTAMTGGALQKEPDLENCWAGQNAMRRLGSSHELSGALLYLCMDTSTYTTGSDVMVDGAHSVW